MKVQLSLLLGLAMAPVQVQSKRQWQEIIDHEIASKSNVDASRFELKIEADPFATTNAAEKTASKIPTEPATTEHINTQAGNSLSSFKPTHSSVGTPNTKPSFSVVTGSASQEASKESNSQPSNGWNSLNSYKPNTQSSASTPVSLPSFPMAASGTECAEYELHMMDAWGDGWGTTSLTITGIESTESTVTTHTNSQGDEAVTISKTVQMNASDKESSLGQVFQGSLESGFKESKEICFVPGQCYKLVTSGPNDFFSEEISWELRLAGTENAVLSGGASIECTFAVPDENGHHLFCPTTCSNSISESPVTNSAPAAGSTESHQMPSAFAQVHVMPRSDTSD